MSVVYSYSLGYKYDGKMYVLGPFDNQGNLHYVLEKSRSFASNLKDRFRDIKEDEVSDDIRKYFGETDYLGNDSVNLKVLSVDELPSGEFIKSGYVLISDVKDYEAGELDTFHNVISPVVYAAKADSEKEFGKNEEFTDEYGDKHHEPNASEYMYYMWVDRNSEEFEACIIRGAYNSMVDYAEDNIKYFVLLTLR